MSEPTVHPGLPSPSAHPDTDDLADLAEGLLPPEAASTLDAHLQGCAECRETRDTLVELSGLLEAERAHADAPIPDDIAARLDAALAAAAAETDSRTGAAAIAGEPTDARADARADEQADEPADEQDSGGPRPTRTAAPRRPGDGRPASRPGAPSRRRVRLRQVLMTFAVLVAVGGIGVAVSSGGDIDANGGSSSSAAGAAAVPRSSVPSSQPGGLTFSNTDLATQIQTIVRQDLESGLNRTSGSASASASASATGNPATGFSAGATGGDHASPNGAGSDTSTPSPAGGSLAAGAPSATSAPSCVLAAPKRADLPLHQAVGQYLGVQVYALIYPDTADPAHLWDVFLVQDSCTSPLVLLQRTVPRA